MNCIVKPDLDFFGEPLTKKFGTIIIYFKRCDPLTRNTCKNQTEFDEWITGKRLLILQTQNTFLP